MEGNIIGFIGWCVLGSAFIGLAACAWFRKRPMAMGFWANAETFEVTDVKKYNHALAKLFCIFGIVLMVLGIPLLAGQNSAWLLITIGGTMIESIVTMAVYVLVVEKKYRKR